MKPELEIYKVMAVQMLLHDNESWTKMIKDWIRIQATVMKFLISAKSCSKIDRIRN
jgi:hypothetical protein